jgi:hypothetical protein
MDRTRSRISKAPPYVRESNKALKIGDVANGILAVKRRKRRMAKMSEMGDEVE